MLLLALTRLESHKGIQDAPKPFEPNWRFEDRKANTVFVLGREWAMNVARLANQKISFVIHAIFIREATFKDYSVFDAVVVMGRGLSPGANFV